MERALVGFFAAVLLVSSCGGDDSASPTLPDVPDTVSIGQLPEPPTPVGTTVAPPTVATTTTEPAPVPISAPVGDVADGDRVLLIGDTAMLSLAPRYDLVACDVLSAAGWQIDIEAERGRYVDFGAKVIDELVIDSGDDWAVIGLMFGQHLDTTPDEFGVALDGLLDPLGKRPVLLYTRSEIDDDSATLNDVIRARGDERANVVIVDWGRAVADEQELTLVDDEGLPTTDGMKRIVVLTAAALGKAPGGGEGDCLEPAFTDDSAIVL